MLAKNFFSMPGASLPLPPHFVGILAEFAKSWAQGSPKLFLHVKFLVGGKRILGVSDLG